jgi:hypothetical protein
MSLFSFISLICWIYREWLAGGAAADALIHSLSHEFTHVLDVQGMAMASVMSQSVLLLMHEFTHSVMNSPMC